MNRVVLLSATAVVAVLSGEAPVAAEDPPHETYTVLWDQNSNFGGSVNSQNYGSGLTEYDDAAADDFAVPSGETWHIAEVDVTGVYFNGSGASSEVVTFYTDRRGKPGRVYRGPFTRSCTDNNGSFQCIFPRPVKLPSGKWWVSVVANCDFQICGQWNWTENTTVHGSEAMWENPGGSGKCTSWEPLDFCFGGSPADLAFDLVGKAVKSN